MTNDIKPNPIPPSARKCESSAKPHFAELLRLGFSLGNHPTCTRFYSNELVHNTLPHHTSWNPREFHRSQTHARELRPNPGSTGKVPGPLGLWAQGPLGSCSAVRGPHSPRKARSAVHRCFPKRSPRSAVCRSPLLTPSRPFPRRMQCRTCCKKQ